MEFFFPFVSVHAGSACRPVSRSKLVPNMALTLLLTNQLRIYGVSGCHCSICVPLASAAHGAGWPAICRRLSVRPCCDSFVVRRVQKLLPPPHPSDIFVSYMGILLTFHTPSGEHMQTSSQRWCWDYGMSWSVFFRLFCLHDMYVWSNICLKSLLLQKDFLSFFPQTRIRERDDPRFVHESFPGPRRRPSTLHMQADVGIRALH